MILEAEINWPYTLPSWRAMAICERGDLMAEWRTLTGEIDDLGRALA